MKKGIGIFFSVVLLLNLCWFNLANATEYRLGAGDVLALDVWGYEELKVEQLMIRPDGQVSVPLVGEMRAAGLTAGEFNVVVTQALGQYIREPKVSINLVKLRTTRVYVLGEVVKPGMYELERQHNLLDVIGVAGGYTKDAAKKKIYVIRNGESQKPLEINLMQLLNKGDMKQNVVINDGDTVYLSKNNRLDFARDVLPWITGVYQLKKMDD